MNLRFEEEMKKEKRKNLLRELVYFLIAAVIVIFIAWLVVHFALKRHRFWVVPWKLLCITEKMSLSISHRI